MNLIRSLFLDVMFSGLYRSTDLSEDKKSEILFLNISIFIAAITLFFMSTQSLLLSRFDFSNFFGSVDLIMALIDIVACILMIFLLFFLRKIKDRIFISVFMSISLLIFCLVLVYIGSYRDTGYQWIMAYPIMAVMLLGWRVGGFLSITLLLSVILLTYFDIKIPSADYHDIRTGTVFGVYIVVFLFSIAFENTIKGNIKRLIESTTKLKESIALNYLIKENGDSVCIINQDFVIQSEYSNSLEKIFGETNLFGINIIDLFSRHVISGLDVDKIKNNYFPLFFKKTLKDKQLEEMNSCKEVHILANEVNKIFDIKFKRIYVGDNVWIICFFKDITRSKNLENKIEKEKEKEKLSREKFQQIIFLVKSDRIIIEDFLSEVDEDINYINNIFKNGKDYVDKKRLSECYGIIHGIKSESAYILNVTAITEKFHILESIISDILKNSKDDKIFSNNLTSVVNALGDCHEEIINVRNTLTEFYNSSLKYSNKDSLIVNIEAVVDRLNKKMDKFIKINLSNFDAKIVPKNMKKLVKSILVQLIKNTFVHGIEGKEDRITNSKDEFGNISIMMSINDGMLRILYKDDGGGLDVEKIKIAAKSNSKLENADIDNMDERKLQLLIFHEGFSTSESVDIHAGRGVGMSFVSSSIKKNNGTMSVASRKGSGFQFTFILPLSV